jgi:hypothetical protein
MSTSRIFDSSATCRDSDPLPQTSGCDKLGVRDGMRMVLHDGHKNDPELLFEPAVVGSTSAPAGRRHPLVTRQLTEVSRRI